MTNLDKFGIFNIINSVSSVLLRNSDENPPPEKPSAEKIFGGEPGAVSRAFFPPLQSSMLDTIKSHDEFVKRVKTAKKESQ